MPTPPHIYQVRDIVEMLQKHPQDAECVVAIGGTTHHITECKYRAEHRREVTLDTEGEDRISDLERELFDLEEKSSGAEYLLEEFDKLMTSGRAGSELIDDMDDFYQKVSNHLIAKNRSA